MVELGCCQGDTTKVFSSLFKEVYAYDWSDDNIKEVRKKCGGNVHSEVMDVTNDKWEFPKADVVFVDGGTDVLGAKVGFTN